MSKYSIILPVRNGGEYVKECVNSILSQTTQDFSLEVLDNCSSDGTAEWISSLKDPRISIHYSSKSLTIEENWSRIISIPKNEFITLIGHDDILDTNYLEVMDRLIAKHPSASLYQAHFRYIDSKGAIIKPCKPMDEVQSASEFLAFFLASSIDTMGTGFMMRSKDYDEVGGIPPRYPNLLFADFELFINLSLKGYKATAAEETFAFRLHQSMTTTSSDIKFQRAYAVFIEYLATLKAKNSDFEKVIARYAPEFIRFYCKGLAHRLLRTPTSKREGHSVANFIAKNKEYADRLVPGNNFDPGKEYSIKLAMRIDSNPLFRALFLAFKKAYKKPVYR
jgi:glycosyltransferase involved in cell wall biosynthesis